MTIAFFDPLVAAIFLFLEFGEHGDRVGFIYSFEVDTGLVNSVVLSRQKPFMHALLSSVDRSLINHILHFLLDQSQPISL